MSPSTTQDAPSHPARYRKLLAVLTLAYLVFVVYGSLVPLAFRPLPLDQAWEGYRNIRYLNLGIGSRADWVANLLLFIPLAFLMLGTTWPARGTGRRLLVALLVWAVCVALCLLIEFTQIFFPPRTVSLNDILAESLGALIGIATWWRWGPGIATWFLHWRTVRGGSTLAERFLWLYLAVLFGYSLLPLDLTISPVEVFHKWRDGRVVLIPFTYPIDGAAQWAYNLAADVVIWVPVSFLWVVSGRKRPREAWLWALSAAVVLESLQLLVYSRVTDTTDILTAAAGAGVGSWLAGRAGYHRRPADDSSPGRYHGATAVWLLAFVLWSLVVLAVFWYPYNFHTDGQFLRPRLPMLLQVPFYNYYYGTEFRAVTELIHKLGFFAPLGVTLALAARSLRAGRLRPLVDSIAVALLAGVAMTVELGQVALPAKHPDSTDWLLQLVGGLLGYWGMLFVFRRSQAPPVHTPMPAAPPETPSRPDATRTRAAPTPGSRYDWSDD